MHAEFEHATVDPRHLLDPSGQDLTATVDTILATRATGRLRYEVST